MWSRLICWTPTSTRSRIGMPPLLSKLPKTAFANDYAYNKFAPGPFGIRAPMGAAATVTLPPPASGATPQAKFIRLTDVDGRTFSATLDSKP